MFMSNDSIYQGGQGATTERRSQIIGGQRGVIRRRAERGNRTYEGKTPDRDVSLMSL
jgi:hypothetical protein